MPVTLADISRRVNLTPASVSKILCGHTGYKYKEETRQRVLAVAKELDYRPNIAARALLSRQSFLLGVMDLTGNTWALANLIEGIQAVASTRRYSPLVFIHNGPDSQDENFGLCQDRRVDGLLVSMFIGSDGKPYVGSLSKAIEKKLPIVEIHGSTLGCVSSVRFDYQAAGRMTIEYLVSLGHRYIAVSPYVDPEAQPQLRYWYIQEYVQGCVKAAAKSGARLIFCGYDYTVAKTKLDGQNGIRATIASIKAAEPRPTAMAYYGTGGAENLLRTLNESRLTVPDEFSVVMYDDYPTRPFITDAITSVRHDARMVGQNAAELIFGQMNGTQEQQSLQIAPMLTIGRTTRPCRSV